MINLEAIESVSVNKNAEELKERVQLLERQQARQLAQLQAKLREAKLELKVATEVRTAPRTAPHGPTRRLRHIACSCSRRARRRPTQH